MLPPWAMFAGPEMFNVSVPPGEEASNVELDAMARLLNESVESEGRTIAPPVIVRLEMVLISITVLVPTNPPLSAIKLGVG